MKAYQVPGLSTEKDLDIVYEWARTVPENGIIVEVGSFFGRTAVAFAEGTHHSAKIYCIDYFDDYENTEKFDNPNGSDFWQLGKIYNKEEEFKKYTKIYENIIPLKVNNTRLYKFDISNIDILFLDAAHYNPDDILYISHYRQYIKPGGMICGHDYHDDNRFPDVGKNIKILEKLYKTTVTLYKDSTMWSIRIK